MKGICCQLLEQFTRPIQTRPCKWLELANGLIRTLQFNHNFGTNSSISRWTGFDLWGYFDSIIESYLGLVSECSMK